LRNRRIMQKAAVMLGCLALLFMVGCGSQSTDPGTTDSGSQQPAEEPADSGNESQDNAAENVAYDEEKAKAAYQQSCVGCHGQNLEGGVGPALKGNNLDEKQILEVLENGKGQMPAGLVSGEDAKNLAAWLADQ
jgi:mono/diheme cytochrome c family protein